MKAAVHVQYVPPGVIRIQEIEKPIPADNEVLIRVYAASVSRTDNHVMTGRPFMMRLFTGLIKPKSTVTGSDFAGQVEAIGPAVKLFKVGDRVMGFGGALGTGSHAQYLAFPETKRIVLIPANITYEQAAACLEGAYYAANGILQLKPVQGQKALVYGATGAIGSAYVQYLKYYGVYVTAVCGGENAELVRSWGADKIIDYRTTDFTKDDERYDYVFDAIGKSSFVKCQPLIKKKGIYAPSGGIDNLFWMLAAPLSGGKKVLFPKDARDTLVFIKGLLENARFHPVIDRIYPLEEIAEAFTYVASGQKIGNVVISMKA